MPATVMLARPEARPGVGMKVAVRVGPLLLIAPSVPPVKLTSLLTKLEPGSSLKLKVMVAVWPDLSAAVLLVIASVGATVSIAIAGVGAAAPRLPATSV